MADSRFPSAYWQGDSYYILDQTLLPAKMEYICASDLACVRSAIVEMRLRGAPLIGAAASAGMALGVKNWPVVSAESFMKDYDSLISSRPTAVNLRNVLDEIKQFFFDKGRQLDKDHLFKALRTISQEFHDNDVRRNMDMGAFGARYIEKLTAGKKLRILTHCNAGALATCGYGTALGVIRALSEKGLVNMVWVDETRPYLQGSRLTAFELCEEGIPHTVITDSTAAFLMAKGEVDLVITGADRMAVNGDFANKIGTYSLSVNAGYHNIPFFTALPMETFDLNLESGAGIVIEERSDDELFIINGKRMAPEGSKGLHLGFDMVPGGMITAVITEKGVIEGKINADKISRFLADTGAAGSAF